MNTVKYSNPIEYMHEILKVKLWLDVLLNFCGESTFSYVI